MRIANASNGLAFPPWDAISFFQSQHGHHASCGYFADDAMPWSAAAYLLQGGTVTIVDATRRHKRLTDALRWGVPTWCLVFNRAVGLRGVRACAWQTPAMVRAADGHRKLVHAIRRLSRVLGHAGPAVVGENVLLECHQAFIGDDKPRRIAALVAGGTA